MARKNLPADVTIRGAAGSQLIFRNFEGAAGKFNNAGDRNFCLIIDEELANQLDNLKFNIKRTKARDDYDSVPYIKIRVGYTYKDGTDNQNPPKIFKIDSTGMKLLTKDQVKFLDGARIKNVDLEFSANDYIDRETGEVRYSAYLKSLYATVEESALEREYNERFAGMDAQDPNELPFKM